jgi:hypothetical protein
LHLVAAHRKAILGRIEDTNDRQPISRRRIGIDHLAANRQRSFACRFSGQAMRLTGKCRKASDKPIRGSGSGSGHPFSNQIVRGQASWEPHARPLSSSFRERSLKSEFDV